MSLEASIRSQVIAAFNSLGDLAKPYTYFQRSGTPVRDVVSGKTTYPLTEITIPKAVKARFKKEETDSKVEVLTDEKILFPRAYLPLDFETGVSDYLVDGKGRVWEIQRDLTDPATAVAILHVRSSRKVAP